MAFYQTTFLGSLTSINGNPVYSPSAGLTNVVFKAQPDENLVSSASEVATGLYQWLVPDLSAPYKLYVNGNVVTTWGGSTGRYIATNDLATISYVDTEIAGRVHREGDTLIGPYYLTYATVSGNMDVILMTGSNVSSSAVPTKGYVDYRIAASTGSASSLTSTFVTILTDQTVYGQKTFYLNSGAGLQMQMQSTPPNGGVIGWNSKPLAANQMLHDFKNSSLTGTGNIICSTASINTSSSRYILGNPNLNDFVWRKWIVDNFQPIVGGYQSNTILVDSSCTGAVDLKLYPTINEAISAIPAGGITPASDNIWTLYIKQHTNSTGYAESIELPDYINLIGEGVVRIQGQFTRPGTSEVLSSKIQNLHITSGVAQSHNLERLEAFNCILTAGDSIDIESSKLNNVEMYALSNITSSDNNKIKNCIGNKNVSWQTNDVVLGYDFISNITY